MGDSMLREVLGSTEEVALLDNVLEAGSLNANQRVHLFNLLQLFAQKRTPTELEEDEQIDDIPEDVLRETVVANDEHPAIEWVENVENIDEGQVTVLVQTPSKDKTKPANKTCKECGKVFANQPNLIRHINSVHLEIRRKCPICGNSVKDLNGHRRKVHEEPLKPKTEQFACSMCGKIFDTESRCRRHLKEMHLNQKDMRKCEHCNKSFNVRHIKAHIRQVHMGEKRRHYVSCPLCPKIITRKYDLDKHIRQVHYKERVQCSQCEEWFSDIAHHIRHAHKDKPRPKKAKRPAIKVQCPVCDKTISSKAYLKLHMRNVHEKNAVEIEQDQDNEQRIEIVEEDETNVTYTIEVIAGS